MKQAENGTQPTPGPWKVRKVDCRDSLEPVFLISAESTLHLYLRACADGFVPGQNEANANLIATAPDFLAACTPERLDALDRLLAAAAEYCYDDRIAGNIGGVEEVARDLRAACGKVTEGGDGV